MGGEGEAGDEKVKHQNSGCHGLFRGLAGVFHVGYLVWHLRSVSRVLLTSCGEQLPMSARSFRWVREVATRMSKA